MNVRHRHLSASQKAIAAAEAVIINNDLSYDAAAKMFGTSQGYVSKAAALIANAPDLAEKVKLGLGSPGALVVSLNVKRRSLNKGQVAVAAAEAINIYRPKLSQTAAAKMFGVAQPYVSMAAALLQDAPRAAQAVKDGKVALSDAHRALVAHREQRDAARGALEAL